MMFRYRVIILGDNWAEARYVCAFTRKRAVRKLMRSLTPGEKATIKSILLTTM